MEKIFRHIVLILILSAGILGGCALIDKDDEGVTEAARIYADAVCSADLSDIVSSVVNGNEYAAGLSELVSPSCEDPVSFGNMRDMVLSTLTYEIDEASVESSKKNAEGYLNITYTMVDYEQVKDEVSSRGGDAGDYLEALGSADAPRVSFPQTVELVFNDGAWQVEDKDLKDISELYSFYNYLASVSFVPLLSDYVDCAVWFFSDDDVYTNVSQIEFDIIPTAGEGQEITWEFYYEYYLDGEKIYESGERADAGTFIEACYGTDYSDDAAKDQYGHLIDGQYRCVIYDLSGNVIASSTCSVVTAVADVDEVTAELVNEVCWWGSSDGVYTDVDTIELDIVPVAEAEPIEWVFDYRYYLNGSLIFESEGNTDRGSLIESFYGPAYDENAPVTADGFLAAGNYRCVVYNPSGEVLAQDSCIVIND